MCNDINVCVWNIEEMIIINNNILILMILMKA